MTEPVNRNNPARQNTGKMKINATIAAILFLSMIFA